MLQTGHCGGWGPDLTSFILNTMTPTLDVQPEGPDPLLEAAR